ncbi:CBS domain-containing protein [Tessaracoccus coleopterorum]|uniref:CBS domain-containing protein n=1 Tax=Tessaracoccus coleopterorum TaxID=2714950 RepID=UPI0018D33CC8|nr:CBS domain-containing protein [Tessaracoccus coleopterorum]
MDERGVRHLPVVDGQKVIGVISRNDIAAASPSKATTLSAQEATYLMSKLTVGKVMSRPPVVVSPTRCSRRPPSSCATGRSRCCPWWRTTG